MNQKIIIALLIGLCSPLLAVGAESGTAIKADTLRAEPFAEAIDRSRTQSAIGIRHAKAKGHSQMIGSQRGRRC